MDKRGDTNGELQKTGDVGDQVGIQRQKSRERLEGHRKAMGQSMRPRVKTGGPESWRETGMG